MNYKFMNEALKCAQIAFDNDEVPIGAVIVKDNKILAKATNLKENSNCCLAHAEIISIFNASRVLKNWRLENCDIYVTLDPCPMCASAIKQARIKNVYSALSNSNSNNLSIISEIFVSDSTNPSVNFLTNLAKDESQILLSNFFSKKRK